MGARVSIHLRQFVWVGCVRHPAGPWQPQKLGNRVESRLRGFEIRGHAQTGQNGLECVPWSAYFPDKGITNRTCNHVLPLSTCQPKLETARKGSVSAPSTGDYDSQCGISFLSVWRLSMIFGLEMSLYAISMHNKR